jgi:pimeloyl-ACP methyl ester carboxylesterase
MTKDPFLHFLASSTQKRLATAADGANETMLTARLGADALRALRRLGAGTGKPHLSFSSRPNLVFVPGIMGSSLMSKSLQGVWWIDARTRNHLDDLRLAPDGMTDANPESDVEPFSVDVSYEPFLAAVLATPDFHHVTFPYDWRKPIAACTGDFARTLRETRKANDGKRVQVVAHSMGGLVVREALRADPKLWEDVEHVVFLATPHYGSPAIAGYLKNHLWGFELLAVLGLYLSRPTFRSLWGALCLLPAPPEIYPGTRPSDKEPWRTENDSDPYVHPCANFDLYDAAAWSLGLTPGETAALQTILDATAAFHRQLFASHMALDQSRRDQMTVIAGVGFKTLFRLEQNPLLGFLWNTTKKVTSRVPNDSHRDGDGRVPLASAMLEHARDTRYARSEHGSFPTVKDVYEDVFRLLRGQPMLLPKTPAGALG